MLSSNNAILKTLWHPIVILTFYKYSERKSLAYARLFAGSNRILIIFWLTYLESMLNWFKLAKANYLIIIESNRTI